ncbi:MAG: glycoside hydrolase family 88 protein [Lachnospiraceae bacterium]|nr:glycoside hydrolase family 88 protein [Lachnospiraceae bacterium]
MYIFKEENRNKAAMALLAMQRHSWEQGMAMQAFYESGCMEMVIQLAQEAVYRSEPDGRVASIGVFDGVTDPCCTGEALLAAARKTGDETLQKGYEALLHWVLHTAPRSEEGILYHLNTCEQFWVDSLYMLPPFLAAAGYYQEALQQFYGYWDALYDEKTGLFYHQWKEDEKTYVNLAHWGVGNGWALTALVRMYRLLPESFETEREDLQQKLIRLVEDLLPFMMENGLFHDTVDDATTFAETNLSQMMAYTLYRGMEMKILPNLYGRTAEHLRDAANKCLDSYGFVRGVCGAPTFDKPGIAPEGQAFYLLMEQARMEYMENDNE